MLTKGQRWQVTPQMTEIIGCPTEWVWGAQKMIDTIGHSTNKRWWGYPTNDRDDRNTQKVTDEPDGLLPMKAATHNLKYPHNCNESNYYWPSSQLRSTAWFRLRQHNEAFLKLFDLWEITKAEWTVSKKVEGGSDPEHLSSKRRQRK